MYSYIERGNLPVLKLDDTHPAKRFLSAFMDCRMNCSERELKIGDQTPIEQTWISATDGRAWTFSGFIYAFICFDIVLDGFLESAPHLTESEVAAIEGVPKLRPMMYECAAAAQREGINEILELTDQVQEMLDLWDAYLGFRQGMVARADAG